MAKAPDEADGRVRDVMSPSSHAFDEGHLLVDALDEMKGPPVGGVVPVIAGDGRLRGLLVRRDGIEALRQASSGSLTVGEVCRSGVSVGVDESIHAALSMLERESVGRIPVVDGHNLVGDISRRDIRNFHEKQRQRQRRLEPQPRSQVRWRRARPHKGLTWGMEISGEAFIAKAEAYGALIATRSSWRLARATAVLCGNS